MAIVVQLGQRVDPGADHEAGVASVFSHGPAADGPAGNEGGEAFHVESLVTGETELTPPRSSLELERQDAHTHEVAPMDPLEALGEDHAHAEQARPFAAQSRDEPAPYSWPARISNGTPSAL